MTETNKQPRLERFNPERFYDRYRITIQMREKICGGIPKSRDLIEKWIRARTKYDDALTAQQIDSAAAGMGLAEVTAELTAEKAEDTWNGFMHDEHGLYLEDRQVKSMVKQCASVLQITKKKSGSKQILAEGSVVRGHDGGPRVYLGVTEPTGMLERPINVMTPQGPRTAIKRCDFVEGATITFEVWVLGTHAAENRHIGEEDLVDIMTFAQENGLGADRSQSFGKFDVIAFDLVGQATRKLDAPVVKPTSEEKAAKKAAEKAEKAAEKSRARA